MTGKPPNYFQALVARTGCATGAESYRRAALVARAELIEEAPSNRRRRSHPYYYSWVEWMSDRKTSQLLPSAGGAHGVRYRR